MKLHAENIAFYLIIILQSDYLNMAVQTNIDEYNIFMNITENYNRNIRPTSQVDFAAFFTLKQIVSIDEKNQIMMSNSYVALIWTDKRLLWDPAYFNGVNSTVMSTSLLWTMDMFVINTADTSGYLPMPSQSLAYVQYDGLVYVIFSMAALRTRCQLNVKYFPFDTQNCSVKYWF